MAARHALAGSLALARRYFDTVRYLTLGQAWRRLVRSARRRSGLHGASATPELQPREGAVRLLPGWALLADEAGHGPWEQERQEALSRAQSVMRGHFTFLQQSHELGLAGLPWNDPRYSRLWRYHLHYFDYALDLALWSAVYPAGFADAVQTFEQLVADWIAHNPAAGGDGWHPYTVSLRLVNWISAVQQFGAELERRGSYAPLARSITAQARYLDRNLELDVRGNHLLENLRALVCCSLFFGGREALHWRQRALHLLEGEVQEQILADGGHFERTPGYHVVVLKNLIEIAVWLERETGEAPPWLRLAIARMLEYLVAILPPSGQLPLVKDTGRDVLPDPQGVLSAGALLLGDPRWKRSERLPLFPALLFGQPGWERFRRWPLERTPVPTQARPDSGYYLLRDDKPRDFLIFDAGKPCPDYLPAHAHADLLSYELIAAGQPLIVDSGVYEYTGGAWRAFFRSTRAHNTVEVGGQDQSEVWGSFRVARRARPRMLQWQVENEQVLVQAEHDGYRRLAPPVIHRRTIQWRPGHFWLVVDQLLGKGQTTSASHLHWHPDLHLQPIDENVWRVSKDEQPFWVTAFGHASHTTVRGQREPCLQGWYSERFGQLCSNDVLSLQYTGSLPCCFGYIIALDAPASAQLVATSSEQVVYVSHGDTEHTLPLTGGRKLPPR